MPEQAEETERNGRKHQRIGGRNNAEKKARKKFTDCKVKVGCGSRKDYSSKPDFSFRKSYNSKTAEEALLDGLSKKYIAYGSNLNREQMRHRCPTAKIIAPAILKGWRITFRGNGVANIEPDENASVPVLVWKIYPQDEIALDRYEGVPYVYHKEMITVNLGEEKTEAMAYIMNSGQPEKAPSAFYYNIILEGYREAGFNPAILAAYVDAVKKQPHMTEEICRQLMSVHDDFIDLLDLSSVLHKAKKKRYYALADYVENHVEEYIRYALELEEKEAKNAGY